MKKIWYLCLLSLSLQSATQSNLILSLERHLTTELRDVATARILSTIIVENALSWTAPTVTTQEINTIVAYAFGNRILPNGNRSPGPMNEALADLVVRLYAETKAPVYAQWEIVQALGNRIPTEKIVVINPKLDALGNVVYLDTPGVASAVANQVTNPQKLGKVAVIAFADHLYRCIKTSRDAGMNAYAPAGYVMPSDYDSQSGQPWTRNRKSYLLTDMYARMKQHFEKEILHSQK